MNSPKYLNYETRPAKFTERKMLLSSFLRICNLYGGNYQYIGLGGVSFTDFKLFHKELHIDEMYSLEGGNLCGGANRPGTAISNRQANRPRPVTGIQIRQNRRR